MAAAALPSHIIGKMTKQGGLRLRVVVYEFSSRLPQIREENFHRGQLDLVAPASRTRDSVCWGKQQIGDVESLPPSGMWREEAHETKQMTRRAEMRTLSRRFLNRRTAAAKIEVTAVEFESDVAIGQSEIADDQVSACLRRETLAVRPCIMDGEKQVLLHRRSTSASGGAGRTKSHRALIMIGYPPTSAFAICEFVRRRCPFEVGYPAAIRLSTAYRPKHLTDSGICDAGLRAVCPRPRIRCRCRIFDRFALTICTCCLQNITL
jgi:hypothetical protein